MSKSRVAVLGTLAELHREPIQYDLKTLGRLVKDLQPDLLCAEIHMNHWQTADLGQSPPEYKEALLPLARRTDIVVVPVASDQGCELIEPRSGSARGLRSAAVWWMNWMLRGLQRDAGSPEVVNSGPFGHMCDIMCAITAWVCGEATRRAWQQANQQLYDNVVQAVRRDPGRRVLVTVDCRRRHQLEARLKALDEIEMVHFRNL